MKNTTISSMPQKDILTIFLVGFLGASIFGVVFGIIGLFLADYLGFPMTLGTEELMMGASLIFYSTIAIPFGAFLGTHLVTKKLKYKSKYVYTCSTLLLLVLVGLVFKDYFSFYMFLIYITICSISFTVIISLSDRKTNFNKG